MSVKEALHGGEKCLMLARYKHATSSWGGQAGGHAPTGAERSQEAAGGGAGHGGDGGGGGGGGDEREMSESEGYACAHLKFSEAADAGLYFTTQFTGFTITKVQILPSS